MDIVSNAKQSTVKLLNNLFGKKKLHADYNLFLKPWPDNFQLSTKMYKHAKRRQKILLSDDKNAWITDEITSTDISKKILKFFKL